MAGNQDGGAFRKANITILNERTKSMDIRIAKRIIGAKVKYDKHEYILNACILRRRENGQYYYQAELKELKANCVLIVSLDKVEELEVEE